MHHTHTHNKGFPLRTVATWVLTCFVLTLAGGPLASVPTVRAASSFRPTIFVNTEAFLVIDDDDTGANVVMRFGDTLAKTLTFNRTTDRFEFNDDVYVSGTLRATGVISGVTLYATRSFSGAGLSDCDTGATSKLLWDTTTGRFSCGTDQTGGSSGGGFGSGNVLTIGDSKYVKKAGDTMTGALTIRPTAGAGTVGLNVAAAMSGRSLNISGTGSKPLLTTNITNGRVGIGTATPGAPLTISGSSPEIRLHAGDYSRITRSATNNEVAWYNRTLMPSNPLIGVAVTGASSQYIISSTNGTALSALTLSFWVKRSASATTKGLMQWANSLSSGNPFIYFRDANGTLTWYVNGGFNLAGGSLTDGAWTHIAVTWDGSTWRSYKNGSEVTTYSGGGGYQSNATSLYFGQGYDGYWTGSLDEIRVYNSNLAAGTILSHYNSGLGTYGNSGESNILSGWHLDENTGVTGEDFTSGNKDMTLTNGPTWTTGVVGAGENVESTILTHTDGVTAGELGILTFGDTLTRTILNGALLIFQTGDTEYMRLTGGNLGIGTTTPKAKLDVVGTISGSVVTANTLRSSGSLVWEGAASGATLSVSGNATFAEDLTFGNALNDAITVNAASWTFANDTAFTINGGAGTLEVVGTLSGSTLRASNMTVSGAIVYSSGNTLKQNAKGSSGQILISQATNAPKWANATTGMIWYLDSTIATGSNQGAIVTMPFGLLASTGSLRIKGAPTGADLIVDIKKDGTSIFSTLPRILAGQTIGGKQMVLSTTNLTAGSELTVHVTQVGSTFAGSGLTIMLNGIRKY